MNKCVHTHTPACVIEHECLYLCQVGLAGYVGVQGGLTVTRWVGKYFTHKAFMSEQEQLVSTVRLLGLPCPD